MKLCECGCGKVVGRRFVLGHHLKGKTYEEIYGKEKALELRLRRKKKVFCKFCGDDFLVPPHGAKRRKFCSRVCANRYHMNDPMVAEKISKANMGNRAVIKGLTYEQFYGEKRAKKIKKKLSKASTGRELSERTRKIISERFTGENNPMYGNTHTEEARKKMERTWFEKGGIPWNIGFGEYIIGENNPNWQEGISFEPYSTEFNDLLKEKIRKRDKYICQECGSQQNTLSRRLDIHHIDYDKKNNNPSNLISLCNSCNLKVNHNRDYWTKLFKNKMGEHN